jgi:hypothetical protein
LEERGDGPGFAVEGRKSHGGAFFFATDQMGDGTGCSPLRGYSPHMCTEIFTARGLEVFYSRLPHHLVSSFLQDTANPHPGSWQSSGPWIYLKDWRECRGLAERISCWRCITILA